MLYTTSVPDESWPVIETIFLSSGHRTNNRKHSLRSILDACLYLADNGTKWRNLPNDFPPWKTVYHYFRLWSVSGLWQDLNLALVESIRFCEGRMEQPSLVSIDSQSQTAEPGIECRGIDGNKKINGRKRHLAVDCLGLMLYCLVGAANDHDSKLGKILVDRLNDREQFPRLEKILGDNAYGGLGAELSVPVSLEAEERRKGQKGFVPEAFRWAVERSFAWLNRQRRLCRNFEKRTYHQESMNYIGNIKICIKRLSKYMTDH